MSTDPGSDPHHFTEDLERESGHTADLAGDCSDVQTGSSRRSSPSIETADLEPPSLSTGASVPASAPAVSVLTDWQVDSAAYAFDRAFGFRAGWGRPFDDAGEAFRASDGHKDACRHYVRVIAAALGVKFASRSAGGDSVLAAIHALRERKARQYAAVDMLHYSDMCISLEELDDALRCNP
jgi:hypothetical protein